MLDQLPVPMICMDVANGYSEHFVQVRPLPRASLPPESHGVGRSTGPILFFLPR